MYDAHSQLNIDSDMVVMFEEAFKKEPQNEDLAAQTFFANVRASRWNFAQQVGLYAVLHQMAQISLFLSKVAGKMYKQFQEDRYLYWNAMSAVQQVCCRITDTVLPR